MSDDEFDEPNRAPSPAHERQWRHPAEFADAARTEHLTAPPPLSRRLTALTASVSVIASVAVLAVAIPKGISSYREEVDEPTPTSSPFLRVKNAAVDIMTTVNSDKGPTTAISMGRGYWVVSSEAIDATSPLWISAPAKEDLPVRLVSADSDAGIAILKTDAEIPTEQVTDLSTVIEPSSITDFSKHRVLDGSAAQILVPSASLSTKQQTNDIPITTQDEIHGIALVVDSSYQAIGIVVRRGHASWMLQKETINRLMRMASGEQR